MPDEKKSNILPDEWTQPELQIVPHEQGEVDPKIVEKERQVVDGILNGDVELPWVKPGKKKSEKPN